MTLGYHEFSPDNMRDVYSMTREKFYRQMTVVQNQRCRPLSVTFDDGHRSQYKIAVPTLQEMKIAGLFFITTSWVGDKASVMQWSELRELLEAGHKVGSHSHHHRLLTNCSDHDLRIELDISKQTLEDQLGTSIDSISMPGGRVDRRVLEACAAAGYQYVYTSHASERTTFQAKSVEASACLEIVGRLIVRRNTSDKTLANYLSGKRWTMHRLNLEHTLKYAAKSITGDSIYQYLWHGAVRSRTDGAL